AEVLASAWSEADATGPAVAATARVARHLGLAGLYDRADALHERIDPVAARFSDDPVVGGQVAAARRLREHFAGHLGRARDLAGLALGCYERAGYLRDACIARINLGYTERILGAYAE